MDNFTSKNPSFGQNHLSDLVDNTGWDSQGATTRLIELMTETHLDKIEWAKLQAKPVYGTLFKRTRIEGGQRIQRAEVRFDGIAGCLRTPTGGSSRQTVIRVYKDQIKTRLLSPRETARLMRLPDTYKLPTKRNDALHLTGDGVVVPVVQFLSQTIFEPALELHYASRSLNATFANT